MIEFKGMEKNNAGQILKSAYLAIKYHEMVINSHCIIPELKFTKSNNHIRGSKSLNLRS